MSTKQELERYAQEAKDREQPYINKIVDYWAKRGKVAKIEVIGTHHKRGVWLKSNIVNGRIE